MTVAIYQSKNQTLKMTLNIVMNVVKIPIVENQVIKKTVIYNKQIMQINQYSK